MAPMTDEELQQLRDEVRRRRIGPAADFTAESDLTASENASKMRVSPRVNLWRRAMKWTVEQLDKHRERKRLRHQQLATVPLPKSPKVVSATAPHSTSAAFGLVKPAPVDGEFTEVPKTQPAATPRLNAGMYLGSMGLCFFAAWYSVQGLVEFFSFSPTETLGMAMTMEAVKFIGVSWVAANWSTLRWWRFPLVLMLLTMAAITFIGDYVHLTQSHVGNRPQVTAKLQLELADVERKITEAQQSNASETQNAALTTAAIGKLISQGQPKAALKELTKKKSEPKQEQTSLAELEHRRDELNTKLNEPSKVSFLASLLNRDPETISAWLILLLTLMLDPFGLALNAAVASRR